MQGGGSSPLLANNRSEPPLRQERACAAHGTAGRAQQPGCGPCPGGAAAGSHWLLFPTLHPASHRHPERGPSERTASSGSWYSSICYPPSGGLKARTDFSAKSLVSHPALTRRMGLPPHRKWSVRQTKTIAATLVTGRTGPRASTASSATRK